MEGDESGFLWAYLLDGAGGGKKLGWDEAQAWKPSDGPLWVHLDRTSSETQEWLRERSGVDLGTCEALLAEETRPRSYASGDGVLLILRGVNLNPGAEPDDMISLRIWAESQRLITLRQRAFQSTTDVAEAIEEGKGPEQVGSLIVQLGMRITGRMEPVIENLEDLADALEEGMTEREPKVTRSDLAEFRRQVIALRRYLAPQRAVFANLVQETFPGFQPAHRSSLRELADRTMRHVEDLEALRERAGVIHDELANHIAEQLNTRMYVVSLVAAIFLPLGLLTGLLGINVGGIPGANDQTAFMVVCGILVGVGALLAVTLRLLKWL